VRSKARLGSHPLHPMLIPFPLAFLTGAFLFHLIGTIYDAENWWITGAHLTVAGILAALVAAIPGLIDYFRAIPHDTRAKRRGRYHMTVNLLAVLLFAVSLLLRGKAETRPDEMVLILQGLGLALLGIGGWLGGSLVYHNHIGVPEASDAEALAQ